MRELFTPKAKRAAGLTFEDALGKRISITAAERPGNPGVYDLSFTQPDPNVPGHVYHVAFTCERRFIDEVLDKVTAAARQG